VSAHVRELIQLEPNHLLTCFRNVVILIICIVALVCEQITYVQTILIGSMMTNLLLAMGLAFFFGGITCFEQYFNESTAKFAGSLLALAVCGLIVPTAYIWAGDFNPATSDLDEHISRGTAIILLVVYGIYLYFQLTSHKEIYNSPSQKVKIRNGSKKAQGGMLRTSVSVKAFTPGEPDKSPKIIERNFLEDKLHPTLTICEALVTLGAAITLICLCAISLLGNVDHVTCRYSITELFVGATLLPIASNMTELVTAISVAIQDKMDLIIGVTIGSTTQLALLVTPAMVILGWIIHSDMTLVVNNFLISELFITVILVNYLIRDGKSRKLYAHQSNLSLSLSQRML
jgi:Ca2+:H+ antiporter